MSDNPNHNPGGSRPVGGPPISPLSELFAVAWPTVLTMTSYTVMQFVDSFMVSRIGPDELSAQGNGGLFVFVPLSFAMGLMSVVNTYVAQHLGADQPQQAPRYAWNAMWLGVFAWLLLLPYAMVLPQIFTAMGHPPHIVEMEVIYARILLAGAFITMMSRGISHFFYGLHRPKVVLIATVLGNITNVFGNWVLIFGHLGFPELGIVGAAIGTVMGVSVELLIPLAVFLGPRLNAELATRSAWRFEGRTIADLWRIGWPKSAMFGNEMICWAIFMAYLIPLFGEAHMSAGWIALRYMHLSFMPAVGISVAVTAVVGRYIGAGAPDTANQRAWLGVRLSVGYMGLCALAFIVFRRPLVGLFIQTDDPALEQEILRIGTQVLICAAVFQVFDAIAIALSGALSGAGDTVWPGVVTVVCSWLFIVGGGAAMVRWAPQLESLGPWIGAAAFVIVLGIAFFWRWTSGRWRLIRLIERVGVGENCPECGYDLRATPAMCPECGWSPQPATVEAAT